MLNAILIGTLWLVLSVLGYWQFIDYQEWNPWGGVPIWQSSAFVERGPDTATIFYSWTLARECDRQVELWVINGKQELIRQHRGSSPHGVPMTRESTITVHVPLNASVVRSVATFDCNPLKSYRFVQDTPIPAY